MKFKAIGRKKEELKINLNLYLKPEKFMTKEEIEAIKNRR